MTLEEQILDDFKAAMKGGPTQARRKSTLSFARSAIHNAQIDAGHILSDAEVQDVLRRQIKQRRDSIDAYNSAKRPDLAAAEQEEADILSAYLPKEMSRDEIAAIAREIIAATGAKGPADLGKVMPQMMRQLKDQADGRLINQVVRQELEQVG